MQESVFENINAWLIGTAAVTLVGSVLVTLLNGKKTYVLGNCIIHRDKRRSCVVNATTTQLGMENKVDYNGQMTGMPLRMEFVWVWIALHVLILIFALWGMVSKEKVLQRKVFQEKLSRKNQIKKTESKKSSRKKPYQRTRQLRRCGQRVPSCGRIPKEGESFVRAADQNCNKRSRK